MPFLKENIDRAIVVTQYDLRGFMSAFGIRIDGNTPKTIYAITVNLPSFAAGLGKDDETPTDSSYVGFRKSLFDEYLVMCKRLAGDCDRYQKEAIQLIIRDIFHQAEKMKAEIAEGKREASHYLLLPE